MRPCEGSSEIRVRLSILCPSLPIRFSLHELGSFSNQTSTGSMPASDRADLSRCSRPRPVKPSKYGELSTTEQPIPSSPISSLMSEVSSRCRIGSRDSPMMRLASVVLPDPGRPCIHTRLPGSGDRDSLKDSRCLMRLYIGILDREYISPMRHIRSFNESSSGQFSLVDMWEYNDTYGLDWASLAQLREAVEEVERSLPEGWSVTKKIAWHRGPMTVPPAEISERGRMGVWRLKNWAHKRGSADWDRFPRDRFYVLRLTVSLDVPEGTVFGESYYTYYNWKTIEPVIRAMLKMIKGGWSGTRWELYKTEEMTTVWGSLLARTRLKQSSLYNLICEAVSYCVAKGLVREGRRGQDRVLVPGPNISAERVRSYEEFPSLFLEMMFKEDDWVHLLVSWPTRETGASSNSRHNIRHYRCDGIRGLSAAVSDYMSWWRSGGLRAPGRPPA
jgi:hypothetical protein